MAKMTGYYICYQNKSSFIDVGKQQQLFSSLSQNES